MQDTSSGAAIATLHFSLRIYAKKNDQTCWPSQGSNSIIIAFLGSAAPLQVCKLHGDRSIISLVCFYSNGWFWKRKRKQTKLSGNFLPDPVQPWAPQRLRRAPVALPAKGRSAVLLIWPCASLLNQKWSHYTVPVNPLQGITQLLSNVKGCIWCQKEQLHAWTNTFSNLASNMLQLIPLRTHGVALKVGMILFSATFLCAHIWPDWSGKFWEGTLLWRINHTVTTISWEEIENSFFQL